MAAHTSPSTVWAEELRSASRRRRLKVVSGIPFVADDTYLSVLETRVDRLGGRADRLRISWALTVKPLAVDDILWAAFLPDAEMGPVKRRNRRVNGAFQVRPLQIAEGSREVGATEAPGWDPELDAFESARTDFLAAHPSVADFVTAVEQDASVLGSGQRILQSVTALIAADRSEEAARLAEEATSRGQRGPMSAEVDVLKYLAAYARGPEAYAAFTASLAPTHTVQVHGESGTGSSAQLAREHHRGRMGHHLASLNGSDPWAVVLSALPPAGMEEDPSTLSYLQAAGSVDAMVLEICLPGGEEPGIVATRYVLGHPHAGEDPRDVEIRLPRSTERVGRHEVFTAAEASEIFERFYRTDTIGDGCALRPVEGVTAEGDRIELPASTMTA